MLVSAVIRPARVGLAPACLRACTIVHALATPYSTFASSGSAPESYLAMIDLYSFADAVSGLFHTSLTYVAEISPWTFAPLFCARPMKSGEAETLLMNVVGAQPTFVATTSAVIVCVGSANSAKTFAPAAFSFTTCWLTSVAVASYFSTSTIFDLAEPRPAMRPL